MSKVSKPSNTKKIHIVHLCNYFGAAGKEMGIVKILRNLNSDIFESTILVLNDILDPEVTEMFNDLNVVNLRLKHGNDVRHLFKLAKLFSELNADIVHTHSWATLFEGILGAKIAQTPVIIHGEHGTFPNGIKHALIQRLFWGTADRVLSVSEVLKKKLSSTTNFPEQRIDSILNGVESSRFFPSHELRLGFRNKFNFSEDDFIIGTVGRYYHVKNNPMLIRAGAELIKSGKNVHIIHVGGGSIHDYEERRKELLNLSVHLGISDNVHLLGPQNDINMILNGLDVFTLTSFNEGCSNVIQEAMFAGKAIVATDVGGNPELIRNSKTGFLVETDDHKALAQKIKLLIENNHLRSQLGQSARKFATEHFSVSKMVEKYEKIYLAEYHKKFPNRFIPLGTQ